MLSKMHETTDVENFSYLLLKMPSGIRSRPSADENPEGQQPQCLKDFTCQ